MTWQSQSGTRQLWNLSNVFRRRTFLYLYIWTKYHKQIHKQLKSHYTVFFSSSKIFQLSVVFLKRLFSAGGKIGHTFHPQGWQCLIWLPLNNKCHRFYSLRGKHHKCYYLLCVCSNLFHILSCLGKSLHLRISEEEPLLLAYWNAFTVLCFIFFRYVSVIIPWSKWANAISRNSTGWVELCWNSFLIAGTTFESGAEADLLRDL